MIRTTPNIDQMEKFINEHYKKAVNVINTNHCAKYLISRTMYLEMVKSAGLDNEIIKEFVQFMPSPGKILSNPFYIGLLIYMLTFLANEKEESSKIACRLYGLITVSYMKKKYFPTCDENMMSYVMNNLHGHSTLKKGFVVATIQMADGTFNKYTPSFLSEVKPYTYYRYIVDTRNKINQMTKIYARTYYSMVEKGKTKDVETLSDNYALKLHNLIKTPKVIEVIAKYIKDVDEEYVENILIDILHDNKSIELFKKLLNMMLVKDFDDYVKQKPLSLAFLRVKSLQNISREVTKVCNNIDDIENNLANCHIILLLCLLLLKLY